MRVARFGYLTAAVNAGLVVLLGLSLGSCKLDKSVEQNQTGPSDLGMSIQLVAEPDVVNADGVSRSIVILTLRDQNGAPIVGKAVEFWYAGVDGQLLPSADSTYVGPIQTGFVMATDGAGVARVVWVAGTGFGSVFVFVRPYGIDSSHGFYRSVQIWQQ